MEEVKQFKIFFSNQLALLEKKLYSRIYASHSDPFRECFVIVPNKGMKFWLERKWAQNGIFFGVEVLPLDSALTRLVAKECRLPSQIALTLAINERLPSSFLQEDPLLAEKIASYFQRYSLYGYSCFSHWEKSQSWQQRIWNEIFGEKEGLFTPLACALTWPPQKKIECHLFGLSHLPRPIAHFFRKLESYFYQLSFCESFWSDILSDKEALALSESELLTSFLEETPPLLAQFSVVMRQGLRVLEESLSEQEEEYFLPAAVSQLQMMQQQSLHFQKCDDLKKDDSLQLHQAPSRLREVEILRNRLLYWTKEEGRKLDEILIVAPDISLYIPYLKALLPMPMLFLEKGDLTEQNEIEALFLFFELEKRRFSSRAVMEFLSHSIVKKKRSFTEEDLEIIQEWIEKLQIRWGFDLEHKNRLMRHHQVVTYPLTEDKNSFKEALERLVQAIALEDDLVKMSQLGLLFDFHEIVYQLYKDSCTFHSEEKQTLGAFCRSVEKVALFYFSEKKEESCCCRVIEQMSRQAEGLIETHLSFVQFVSLFKRAASHTKSVYQNDWGGMICGSLSTCSQIPAKITYILGMDDDAFPRKESPFPFDLLRTEKIEEYLPSKGDFDRGFFMEALFSCQERLVISYKRAPSFVVQELVESLASVTHYVHPEDCFDDSYFISEDPHYRSYVQREYQLVGQSDPPKGYEKSSSHVNPHQIELKELLQFVKSPLKSSFKHKAALYFSKEESIKEEEDFTLSPLTRALMVRRAEPLLSQVSELQRKAAFPQGTFGQLALRNAQKKEREQREIFAFHEIDPHELTSFSLSANPLQIGPYEIVGKIENVCRRGLFVYEKGDFAGMVTAYPAFLTLNCIQPSMIFFGKEKKQKEPFFKEPTPLLLKFIELYLWAKERETLLYPQLIEPILKKDELLLTKRLAVLKTESYDEALAFTFRHRSLPKADELIQTLYDKVCSCYQEVYDNWI